VILTVNQGPDFARATGKIMILSSTNIIVYALGVHIAYPALGIPAGTVLAFLGAFLWVLLLFPLIARISR
jgi:small-conductance mechanosensitive channel